MAMKKPFVILGWTLSTLGMLCLVYGLYRTELHSLTAAAYSFLLSHTTWTVVLSWIVISLLRVPLVTEVMSRNYNRVDSTNTLESNNVLRSSDSADHHQMGYDKVEQCSTSCRRDSGQSRY